MNIKLEAITYEEHITELQKEVAKKGLYKAVKKRCDVINRESSLLPYIPSAIIDESLTDILEMIRLSEENQNGEEIHH